ncbi:MAG: hypothetical protein PHV63_00805 [Candidatus Daviesbacteria bacterium]|nr:hypothetical protein [Candidatus Daviesbacteria bacterium]
MKILLLIIFLILFIFYIPHLAFASTIKINEFYAAGGSSSSNPDWVEIYNEGMDISLYQLIDADNHKKDLSGANCNSHFCTIDWYNLLNKDGDIITLTSKLYSDISIDQVKYGNHGGIPAPGNGQSAGRNPDGTGNWTIFSTPSKGATNNTSPTSAPTSTPTLSPTQTPAPTTTPTPSSSSSQSSSFTISNIPPQINSDQSFNISVNLALPSNPNTNFYLKGAFKKTDSSNYFGQTKVSGSWVKNGSSYSNQFPITIDASGNWSGNLEIMADTNDSGYSGNGDYIFKIGRYGNDGANLTWSNETTIKINNVDTSSSNDSDTSSAPDSNSNTKSSVTPSPIISKAAAPTPAKSLNYSYQIASVAGATTSAKSATPEGTVNVKNQRQTNPTVWLGLALIFAGCGSIGYIYFKKNAKIHIPFRK